MYKIFVETILISGTQDPESDKKERQAGAELGQAQLWLGSRYRQATIAKLCGKIRPKLVY